MRRVTLLVLVVLMMADLVLLAGDARDDRPDRALLVVLMMTKLALPS